jgi:rod shape determining protein RodA
MVYRYDSVYYQNKTLPQRFLEKMDWVLLGIVVFLVAAGLIAIYSATLHFAAPGRYFATQILAVMFGAAGLILFTLFNYQYYRQIAYFIYGLSIVLLVLVLVCGVSVRGTRGWFNFGYFQFQPVEFAKIMFILVFAGYLDRRWREVKRLSSLLLAMLVLLGHVLLILMQPDFSSTLVYFPVALMLLYAVGTEVLYLLAVMLFSGFAVGIPLMSTYFKMQPDLLKAHPLLNFMVIATNGGWQAVAVLASIVFILAVIWWFLKKFRIFIPFVYFLILSAIIVMGSVSSFVVQKSLKEYQRKRLIVFLNPDIDPLGSGYNIIQSKIAIGSGRIFGKGLFSGTQSQLGYLPEQHTDFIFSMIGEETGYIFAQFTMIIYFLFVWRALIISREARDRYGSLVALGLACMFAFYGIINMGMVMGMMPTTGLPLPLISYGGSSMVSSLCAIGILFSIHIRRYTN